MNVVFWDWAPDPPHQVRVVDDDERLPKDREFLAVDVRLSRRGQDTLFNAIRTGDCRNYNNLRGP